MAGKSSRDIDLQKVILRVRKQQQQATEYGLSYAFRFPKTLLVEKTG